ncbi:MAG: hypothetical protein AAF558_01775 [Verrucomicrobiota bacterium]
MESKQGIEVGGQQRKRVSGQVAAVGSTLGMAPWVGGLFGLPFFGAGVAVTLVGLKVISVDPSSVHAPYWVLVVAGLSFVGAGLMVWGMAVRAWALQNKIKKSQLRYPNQPVFADYPWDPQGYQTDRWKPAIQGVAMATGMTVFFSIFNWWAFFSGEGPLMVKIIVVVFNLIIIAVWLHGIKALMHAIKYPPCRLLFDPFPYKAKDWLNLKVQIPQVIHTVHKARLTLRCIEQYYEWRRTSKGRTRTMIHDQLWEESHEFSGDDLGPFPQFIQSTFALPEDGPSTCIQQERPIFWQLELEMDVPGIDLKQRFLVPIY